MFLARKAAGSDIRFYEILEKEGHAESFTFRVKRQLYLYFASSSGSAFISSQQPPQMPDIYILVSILRHRFRKGRLSAQDHLAS